MAEVQKLQLEIVMDETGAVTGVKGLGKATKGLEKSVTESSKKMKKSWSSMVIGLNQGLELAKKGLLAIKKAFDFSKTFLKYRQGMDALARNTGDNADKMVDKLREVTEGTVANRDIMLAANRLVALNVTRDTDKMAQLFEIARLKGKAMGISTTQAISDISTGIGRASPLILDNLGIITKGWDKEAKAANKAMDAQFILNKILKQGSEELGRTGARVLTGAEKFQKFTATMKNLALTIGKILTPVLLPVLEIFTKIAGFVGTAITSIAGFIGKLVGVRGEVEAINKELAKPIMLRLNEKRLRQLEEGIELTQKRIKTTKELIATIQRESSEIKNGTRDLKNISEETAKFRRSQRLGKTTVDEYTESIDKAGKKIVQAQKEIRILRGEIQKQTAGDKPPPIVSKGIVEESKANIADFYAFIDDQRSLNRLKEEEDFLKAKEGLALALEEGKITREEVALERESIAAIHAFNLEEIQSRSLTKRDKAEKKTAKAFRLAWNNAVASVVTDYSAGITNMIFEGQKWKKNFGDFVIDFLKGIGKMIVQLLIMKAIMTALGGLGLFFKEGGMVPSFAEGGKVAGPSHEGGGKQVEVEGGEFITRKSRVTPETLPILMAINKGFDNFNSLAIPVNRPMRGMQAGGMVNRDERRSVLIENIQIVNPNPEELFEQFMEFGEDMGADMLRRG